MHTECSISFDELVELGNKFPQLAEALKAHRAKALAQAEKELRSELNYNISASGINDRDRHVINGQLSFFGSKGGYVAIVPNKGKFAGERLPGQNRKKHSDGVSIHDLTYYLEEGHLTRGPAPGTKRRYRNETRAFKFYYKTNQKLFYIAARMNAQLEADMAASIEEVLN